MNNLLKLWAFLKRDFMSEVSYRLAFVMQVGGMFVSLLAFYFVSRMFDADRPGFDGIRPFDWLLIGVAFQFYFSIALSSFSAKIRQEQMLGTLEAMLVSPTPTSLVIFSSAAWNFTYGAIRVAIYLFFAVFVFGTQLQLNSPLALALGVSLTLLSSAGLGILSASFILYFKRGDPLSFFLSGLTTFFGQVMIPLSELPEWAQRIAFFVPANWSNTIVRGVLLKGEGLSDLREEIISLTVLTCVLLPGGLIASRYAIRRAKREGSLIQY